jgi:predicted  nucleic acid-binding Zn-ribbon protein
MITLKSKLTEMEGLYEEAKSRVEALVKENEALIKDNEAKENKIKELTDNPVNPEAYQAMSEELEQAKEAYNNIQAENAELKETLDTLEKQDHDFEQRVEARSLEIAQAQGVPPVEAKPVAQPAADSNADLLTQLEQIVSPVERRDFYLKNEKAILDLMRKVD